MTTELKSPREHIEALKKSANLQASAHAWLSDYHSRWNFVLTYAALIPTAALLMFPLTTDDVVINVLRLTPNSFKLLNAAVALLAFIAVLVQMVWRPDSLAKAHRNAVDHYANAKSAAQNLLENATIDPTDARVLEEQYLNVQGLPPIPENRFLRFKQRHLQKLQLSQELDRNPWLSLPRFSWQNPDVSPDPAPAQAPRNPKTDI